MSQIQEVELSIEQAKKVIAIGDKALKLADNKLFKELVLDGYFVDEAARLAHLSADLTLTPEQRADIFVMIQGIGFFKAYLSMLVRRGDMASRELRESEQTLTELRMEDSNELAGD